MNGPMNNFDYDQEKHQAAWREKSLAGICKEALHSWLIRIEQAPGENSKE